MQREEKLLESSLDSIIQRVNDIKSSIISMIFKIENEADLMNWPNFLDNYALLSGHLISLSKLLNDKCPQLRNLTLLPLILSPERDDQLAQLTEFRVTTFAHDLVPNYLRTKLEPLIETKITQLEQKAATLAYDNAQKQIGAYQKVVSHVWDIVSKAREEWEVEASSKGGSQQNSSLSDTNMLVTAVGMGKGLKVMTNPAMQGNSNPGIAGRNNQMPNQGCLPGQTQPINKIPSGIKTNIKSAIQVHPYSR